jgi:hypothetical protein
MRWWEEQSVRRRAAINAVLDSERGTDYLHYANADSGFAAWLLVADVTCARQFALSIFDLADWAWRDAYDAGEQPGPRCGTHWKPMASSGCTTANSRSREARHVVEVNEVMVFATGRGSDWWAWFLMAHRNTGRIAELW